MLYRLIYFLFITIQIYGLQAQQIASFNINLPNILTADAGMKQYILLGQSAVLGGNPTAIGGTPPFVYEWSPAQFLDDSTIANPISTPQQNIAYNLKISDANSCIAIDNTNIYISSTHINNYDTDGDIEIFKDLENIRIRFSEAIINNSIRLELYDIRGRQLALNNFNIQDNSIIFSTNNISGISFLRIISPNINRIIKLF